jgi:cation:H+ antiporter
MLLDILLFIIAFPIIVYSSDFFTENAVKLARSLGVSQFLIGITIVGIGTSLPEIVVSDYASFSGISGIVIGNVVGSNITNISLVLGLSFFIRNTAISDDHIFKDSIIHLFVISFSILLILTNNSISRLEGVILTGVYILYIIHSIKFHKKPNEPKNNNDFNLKIIFYTLAGLVGVLIGSKLLVDSAVVLADQLGISSAVIGLTIIALGTSLPELAVSISAARRGFTMLILGNVIGSNITNIGLAMGTASMIKEVVFEDAFLFKLNLAYMLLLSLILIPVVRKKEISRWWGAMYLLMYVFFICSIYSI